MDKLNIIPPDIIMMNPQILLMPGVNIEPNPNITVMHLILTIVLGSVFMSLFMYVFQKLLDEEIKSLYNRPPFTD